MTIAIIPHWLRSGRYRDAAIKLNEEVMADLKFMEAGLWVARFYDPKFHDKPRNIPAERHRKHRTLWLRAKAGM